MRMHTQARMHGCAHVARRRYGFEENVLARTEGTRDQCAACACTRRRAYAHVERRRARAHAGAHVRMSRGGGARRGRVHTCDAVPHRSRKSHCLLHDRVITTNDWSSLVASETIMDHDMLHYGETCPLKRELDQRIPNKLTSQLTHQA